ncbi:MAG: leucine-rich repeat domain-containing protein [Promethearchaeota archaeon]
MSDDKRIKKEERKAFEEIEKISGVSFKRIAMTGYTRVENLFNFNDEGSIIMFGLDLTTMDLDDQKLNFLGENVCKFKNLESFLLKIPEDKDVPEWLRSLTQIKALIMPNSFLKKIPEYIKEFMNLESLHLGKNQITILPEWLPNLPNLKEIDLSTDIPFLKLIQPNIDILKALHEKNVKVNNTIFSLHVLLGIPLDKVRLIREILNEDGVNFVAADIIKSIDEPMGNFHRFRVNPRVLNGKIVHLAIYLFRLKQLPENFGELDDLTKLTIKDNKLESLPESIGKLKNLKELDLSINQLTNLPESFVNLTSITKLDLSNNQFTQIPTQLWALKDLTELNMSNNPLDPENMTLSQKVPDLIREYLRKKATIKVFISHAVIDFEPYHIEELVNYLQRQKEISQVFFCEEDLAGNIDQWMLDAVQQCQLIIFIATNKSVFNSPDCANELQLANKFSIPVIPLKGKDVDWPDLAEKNLSRELGLEYDTDNFEEFCANLYKYVENFKREINLMEKEERKLGIIDIYERFRLLLDEKLSEVVRKIDELANNMKFLIERIDNLEKRV